MRRSMVASLLLILCACTTARTVAAPAPEGALACALKQVTALGYIPVGGGIAEGFLTVRRDLKASFAKSAANVTARVATLGLKGVNHLAVDRLTISNAGGILRITSVGLDQNGRQVRASEDSKIHAESILTACGVPGAKLPATPNSPQG